ncbi:MAG: hypothetical protein KJO21_07725 [Verrucomicrobiae bacterium]|nr:hypothetical protein [Verrucomicrobiae bacterium]NNJ43362.1 hypothetical protein [Akkermansiaceae bacterium]
MGDWKLRINDTSETQKPLDPALTDGPSLHKLKEDPLETNNLAKQHPEKVEALLAQAEELLSDVYGQQVPLGTWPGVELEEAPLKAAEVLGKWLSR